MQAAALEQATQWLAGRKQVLLADEFIETRRPHPVRERTPAGVAGGWLHLRASHASILSAQVPVFHQPRAMPVAMPSALASMS